MNEPLIELQNVSKVFKIPVERRDTLKENFINLHRRNKSKELFALKNIDFKINRGDFIGIIGKNGSGKSTLLKIIANIYTPTKGMVKTNGTISPFLELGVGFNGDLSARENVYLNGIILGLSRREIDEKYKRMVEFAGLENFMEMKLKNFSSGMQMRLAFTVAVQVDADVYVCDEVLSVGDEAFQKKCLNTFRELKNKGKTIIFVSHDLDSVRTFCDKTALIENGSVKTIGDTKKVIDEYLKSC
jgi:ABC-type polysaccharide/polyol phosphate transport system ATPase subunit